MEIVIPSLKGASNVVFCVQSISLVLTKIWNEDSQVTEYVLPWSAVVMHLL